MMLLTVETRIAAPPQICFDLARDVEFHVESTRESGERIVAGRTSGLWEAGDEMTFEARHLGVRQKLSARITVFEPPHLFVDEMTRGAFASLRHTHQFISQRDGGTLMRDLLEWKSPLGPFGSLADLLVVKRHMHKFLSRRGLRLKERAERDALKA